MLAVLLFVALVLVLNGFCPQGTAFTPAFQIISWVIGVFLLLFLQKVSQKVFSSLKGGASQRASTTLSRKEPPDPCLDGLLLLFWAQYIEDGPHLLCTGSL